MGDGVFQIAFENHSLVGDRLGDGEPAEVLMLHGAGGAHRGKMRPLRKELLQEGIGSVAFDFIGHGDTGGDLESSSLASRTRQTCAVIDGLGLFEKGPMSVLAASMGGHIAVRLLEHYAVNRMILVVPAMYNRRAYPVRFDSGFSEIIRENESWRDSEGWDLLADYTGKLLLVAAEQDTVIPDGVIEQYYMSARNAVYRRVYTARGVGHMVFTELREHDPAEMARCVDLMAEVIR